MMISRVRSRLVFAGLSIALTSLFAFAGTPPTAVAATTYIVNDANFDCGTLPSTYFSIQSAIDDAILNHVSTILVCPGTYGPISIAQANKLTIKNAMPDSITTTIIQAPAAQGGVIAYVYESQNVVLDGLTFDGGAFADNLNDSAIGIIYEDSTGTIQNSVISDIRCHPDQCGLGYGIQAIDNADDMKQSALTVKNVYVRDVDFMGILAYGPVKLTASRTRVIGNYSGGATYSDLVGILMEGGATGSVKSAVISRTHFGIMLYGASKTTISGNMLSSVDIGISLRADCAPGFNSTSANKITGNTLSEITNIGVEILSSCVTGSHVDSNTISGNTIGGTAASTYGLAFTVETGAFSNKTAITNNLFFDFLSAIVLDADGTNYKLSGNTWLH